MTEFKHTKQQILNFNENDWNFRVSSGYSGYDHKDHPKDEARWIYEADYRQRKAKKEQYLADLVLITEFLDNKYFS